MNDLISALRFLTIIPLSTKEPCGEEQMARAVAWFPLAGLVIGGLLVAADLAGGALGLLPWQRNIAVLILGIVVTGALHIDGVSDTVDGVACSRASREDMLRIMKDSRIGAMGAIALVLDLLIRFLTLSCLEGPVRLPALLLAPAVGRFCVVLAASITPYARASGTGKTIFDTAGTREVSAGFITVLAAGVLLCGVERALLMLGGAVMAALLLRSYFVRRLGGMTGDTLGTVNEAAELLAMNLLLYRH